MGRSRRGTFIREPGVVGTGKGKLLNVDRSCPAETNSKPGRLIPLFAPSRHYRNIRYAKRVVRGGYPFALGRRILI